MTPSPLSTPLPAIAGGGSFLFCNDPSAGSPTERLRFWLRTRLSSGPRLYLKRCAALLPANHPTPLNLWTTTIGAGAPLGFGCGLSISPPEGLMPRQYYNPGWFPPAGVSLRPLGFPRNSALSPTKWPTSDGDIPMLYKASGCETRRRITEKPCYDFYFL